MTLPVRKHPRLKDYDYGQCGCYHVTICTKNRSPLLSTVFPANNEGERATVQLSRFGAIADHYIQRIADCYSGIQPIKYVIMPNHVHLLLLLSPEASADVPTVVHSLKRMITNAVGQSLWQKSYFDVIIRNDAMFQCEWTYIDQNPDKWVEDELFVK